MIILSKKKLRLSNNYRIIGQSFLEQDNVDKALTYFKKSKDYGGAYQDIDMLLDMAFIYYEKDELSQAERLFNEILALYPNEARAYFGLGLIHEDAETYDCAIESYLQAIKIDKQYQQAYFFLAGVYQKIDDFENCEKSYLKAIKINKDDYWSILNLGSLYEDYNMDDKAERMFRKAYRLNPENPTSSFNLGVIYGKKGDLNKAEKYYDISLALDPVNPFVYLNLSVNYKERRMYNEAIEWLNRGIDKNPDEAFLYYHRSCLNLLTNNKEKAVLDAKTACRLDDFFIDYIKMDEDLSEIASYISK